jgi:hypothetical protein
MQGTTETAQPVERRRTFGPGRARAASGAVAVAPSQRELLGQPVGVDARTAELRERIAAAARTDLIGSLLLRR